MPKPSIFVTRTFADNGIKMLKAKGYTVDVYPEDKIIPRSILLKSVRGRDAIISLLTDKID